MESDFGACRDSYRGWDLIPYICTTRTIWVKDLKGESETRWGYILSILIQGEGGAQGFLRMNCQCFDYGNEKE